MDVKNKKVSPFFPQSGPPGVSIKRRVLKNIPARELCRANEFRLYFPERIRLKKF